MFAFACGYIVSKDYDKICLIAVSLQFFIAFMHRAKYNKYTIQYGHRKCGTLTIFPHNCSAMDKIQKRTKITKKQVARRKTNIKNGNKTQN